MTTQDFIQKYGEESQEVTKNYTTKSLGKNYHVKDSFIEFCDNAFDAKNEGKPINVLINIDNDSKTITIMDDGCGIKDEKLLFRLGGTDKDGQEKIGKYGIGVPGAVAGLATKCRYNQNVPVEVVFESARNGSKFVKHILFNTKGEQIIGKAEHFSCDRSDHHTKITFSNVQMTQHKEIMDALELTFEEALKNNLNIVYNERTLGKTNKKTFTGEESEERINVGNFVVYVKWRISSSDSSDEREFEKSGIRIYDKKTGRLLGMNTKYWDWYAGRNAQQNICGIRIGIYIESSIECYDKFGVLPTKNGIAYKMYCNDKDFKELAERLREIYKKASNTSPSASNFETITIGSRSFQPTASKLLTPFVEVGNTVMFRRKWTNDEMANFINDYINLKKKLDKKETKTCKR